MSYSGILKTKESENVFFLIFVVKYIEEQDEKWTSTKGSKEASCGHKSVYGRKPVVALWHNSGHAEVAKSYKSIV